MTTADDERRERNQKVMETLRANGGTVPGSGPILILHTKGAKSGKDHVTPVMYLADGDRYVVFASMAGAPRSPAWYHNLLANPEIDIEVGGKTVAVRAIDTEGEERDALYARQATAYTQFADYQAKTTRLIPVVALEPR